LSGDRIRLTWISDDEAGLWAFVEVVNAVTPEATTSLADLRWADATYPGGARLLAFFEGRPSGATSVGRIYMYDATYEPLLFAPGSSTLAWHDMTAVRPAWRSRGVATALKRATIAWAIAHGLETLATCNDEANAPMRAVNARLGYRPMPDVLTVRGPLAPVET
jgi:GNAT superfamily N-acetyltransferase